MKPEIKTGTGPLARCVHGGIVAMMALMGASAGNAASAYGCRTLETHAALPAVEGEGGVFFAIRPELQAFHGLHDETIVLLSDLNTALAARGTTLVMLPVPTRAQVLSDQLPQMASHLGYNVPASVAVYEDTLLRLKRAGITVADPYLLLRTAALGQERPFFETDPRPTAHGARLLANAVGAVLADHPALADVARRSFTSSASGEVTLPSAMRRQLQIACRSPLPQVTTQSFVTTADSDAGQTPALSSQSRLVVLGASATSTLALNLAGFLSEATGLETLGYGVAKGGAFAAISSYLTSADFQTAPPQVLVWELPVAASLAANGDQPLRELISAASNSCTRPLELKSGSTGGRLTADLGRLRPGAGDTLALDAGFGVPYVRFHFRGADGLVRTRSIYRHADQLFTGQFYLPLSGLRPDNLREVEIETPKGLDARARLALCS